MSEKRVPLKIPWSIIFSTCCSSGWKATQVTGPRCPRKARSNLVRTSRDARGGGDFPKENDEIHQETWEFRHQNGNFTEKWEETTSS